MRIIYQRGFSHLYGLALCTLLNISVSSGALSSRRSDRLAPGTATDTGSAKHTAGYITIMKTTWEPTNTHTHTITVTGACTHDARKHTHTHTRRRWLTPGEAEPDTRWDEAAFLITGCVWPAGMAVGSGARARDPGQPEREGPPPRLIKSQSQFTGKAHIVACPAVAARPRLSAPLLFASFPLTPPLD